MNTWQWKLPVAAAVLALLCGTAAVAQNDSPFEDSPFDEEPQKAPMPDDAKALGTEEPVAPLPRDDEQVEEETAPGRRPYDPGYAASEDRCDEDRFGDTCGTSRDRSRRTRSCDCCCRCDCCGPRLVLGGWLDQGITVNARNPADRFNGPITFNDRDCEYQMNQLWLYAEREVDTGGYGFGVGGRVDCLYGTDWRFTQAYGLETDWNESERFYGAAVPQAYMDVAVDDLTVRMGHYFTIIGYEVVAAPNNFFYSHSYAKQYGEPFTHTGLLGSYNLSDQLVISAGFDRGWNMWEDNNDELSFLGGLSWTSQSGATLLAFAITNGAYDDAGELNRSMYSFVFTQRVTDRLTYVLQHDRGFDNDGGIQPEIGPRENAQWYGINQYILLDVNKYWDLGLRVEWFRDDDGTRVGGIGAPHGWTGGPNIAGNQIGWAGNFFEITLGVNWKPCANLVVRPECRWDWYRGPVDAAGQLPYDAGAKRSQFTFATDVYFTF